MATLDDPTVNYAENEEIGDIEYDAPESGSRAPQLYPGVYDFKFGLEEETGDRHPFESADRKDDKGQVVGKNFVVNHKATVTVTDDQGNSKDVDIRFNRASFYRSAKMKEKHMNSKGGELLRSLNIRVDVLSKEAIEAALRAADGRSMGRAAFGWQFFCKADDLTISTNANTKRGEIRWPKGADNKYVDVVSCPKCGAKGYGRERITDYKLPTTNGQ